VKTLVFGLSDFGVKYTKIFVYYFLLYLLYGFIYWWKRQFQNIIFFG